MTDPRAILAEKVLGAIVKKHGPEAILNMLVNAGVNIKDVASTKKDAASSKPTPKASTTRPNTLSSVSAEQFLKNNVLLPAAGDVVKVAGNIPALHNSLLGAALQATHNNNPIDNMVMGDASAGMRALGAGLLARGGTEKMVADTVANRLYNVADAANSRELSERIAQYQKDHPAPGDYYRFQSNIYKNMPTVGTDIKLDK